MPPSPKSPAPSRRCDCRMELGSQIVYFKDTNDSIEFKGEGELTGDELAAIASVNELLRKLRRGQKIAVSPPRDTELQVADDKIVKCVWLRSGLLKIERSLPTRRYMHAETVEEAVQREQGFTTTWKVALQLPRIKPKQIILPVPEETLAGS